MRDSHLYTLSNGIRVIYQPIATAGIVHCGIFLNVGSRDETAINQGIAHFWEHMAFKGTRKRKAFHILNSLDAVGGELNAYTEKEKIVFYASVRNKYFERAVDILSDITFNSTFPEKEIKRERGVILEEMSMYFDDPDDSIQDEFEAILFKDHSMGMNIIGRPETVSTFRKRDFISFITDHIDTRNIVFSCVGNILPDEVQRVVCTYLEVMPRKVSRARRKAFTNYRPQEAIMNRPVKQARCAIGRDCYPLLHKHRVPFYLLVNLIGGPGMNSRLNMVLREKYGYVYSVEAHYVPYSDTGMFAIFFGTESRHLDKCLVLIKKELEKFCDKPLGVRQLAIAKEQIKGQLAIAEESNLNLMLMMGRSILDFARVPTIREVFDKIDAVSATQLQDIAQHILNERKFTYLIMDSNGKASS